MEEFTEHSQTTNAGFRVPTRVIRQRPVEINNISVMLISLSSTQEA
jgi:hypothetical protein